jgi:hypothetical protein
MAVMAVPTPDLRLEIQCGDEAVLSGAADFVMVYAPPFGGDCTYVGATTQGGSAQRDGGSLAPSGEMTR